MQPSQYLLFLLVLFWQLKHSLFAISTSSLLCILLHGASAEDRTLLSELQSPCIATMLRRLELYQLDVVHGGDDGNRTRMVGPAAFGTHASLLCTLGRFRCS